MGEFWRSVRMKLKRRKAAMPPPISLMATPVPSASREAKRR